MPLRFTDRILAHLAHANYRPARLRDLVRDMRVRTEDREAFQGAVTQLVESERIVMGKGDVLQLPPMGDEIVGWMRVTPRGFGFVVPEGRYREGDLYVPPGSVRDAISGDRVRARVLRGRQRGRGPGREVAGEVIEVLERGQEQFVGVLVQRGRDWFVEPDGRSLHEPVVIRDPHAKQAKAGDKVVIELVHYPEEEFHAEGVITRVLGEAGRPDVETEAVIAAHGLRTEFPPEVTRAATQASRRMEKPGKAGDGAREDLSGQFVFTIDPPDARDFDDAISLARDPDSGECTLGVHIADVAHFIRPGDALDVEGSARGNSVYLPRLVIPMLPEVLSNGVCSLQEGVRRLTKSVFITFDARGKVLSQRTAATEIVSAKRLTYLEAQALIDGDQPEARKHAKTDPVYTDQLVEALRQADALAKVLRDRRRRDGMIVLNLPEVELVFDDDGHVIDAMPEDNAFTHTIIEMFMVEANEALARLFDGLGVPVLRRIHPDPTFGSIEVLRMYARAAHVELPDRPTRQDIQQLLDRTRETPASRAIHFAVLRTLTKATYSPAGIGHFALASEHYAHFTSPIRRYPDLLLHRALEAYLEATDNGTNVPGGRKRRELTARLRDDARVPDEDALVTLGRHCSDTEQESEAAERELRAFLVMQFLNEKHLGDDFDGVVTGVTNAGVFVSIERFLVEGLVRTSDLPGGGAAERWKTDDSTGRLVSGRSGRSIGIGDLVKARIMKVNLASRHLDLALTEMPERAAGTQSARAKATAGPREKGHRKGYKKGRRGRRG